MKIFFKSVLVLLGLTISLFMIGSFSQVSAVISTCEPAFELPVSNANGQALPGQVSSAALLHTSPDGYTSGFGFQTDYSTPGLIKVCKPSPTDLALYNTESLEAFSGDRLEIFFSLEGSQVHQMVVLPLTTDQISKFNSGQSLALSKVVVSNQIQAKFTVTDQGAIAAYSSWDIYSAPVVEGDTFGTFLGNGQASAEGIIQINGMPDGQYKLIAYPMDVSSKYAMRSKVYFNVIQGKVQLISGATADGIIEFPLGNVSLQFKEDSGTNVSSEKSVNFSVGTTISDSSYIEFEYRDNGRFVSNLPTSTNPYSFSFNGGDSTGYSLPDFSLLIAEGNNDFVKTVVAPNFALRLSQPSDSYITWSAIHLIPKGVCPDLRSMTNSCFTQNKKSMSTDYQGIARTNIPPTFNGDYWVVNQIGQANDSGIGSTFASITFSNGVPTSSSGELSKIESGIEGLTAFDLILQEANLQLTIKDQNGNPIKGGFVSTSLKNASSFTTSELHVPNGTISQAGKIALNLLGAQTGTTEVTYTIQVTPGVNSAKVSSFSTFEVRVDETGKIISVSQEEYLPTEDPIKNADGSYSLVLPKPNFFGKVSKPGGIELAPFAWLNVVMYAANGQDLDYQKSTYLFTNEKAEFSSFLEPGTYQAKIDPPFGSTKEATSYVDILVDISSRSCIPSSNTQTTCSSESALNLELSPPNLTAEILAGSTRVTTDWNIQKYVDASLWKWNSDWSNWQYINWIQVSQDGTFNLNVQDDGLYQLKASPNNVEGYSISNTYFKVQIVSGVSKLCPVDNLNSVRENSTCSASASEYLDLQVNLKTADFKLEVSVPDSYSADLQVNISEMEERNGWKQSTFLGWMMLKGSNSTARSGLFAFDAPTSGFKEFRFEIQSNGWGSADKPLAKKIQSVIAGEFDTDSTTDYCLYENFSESSTTKCSAPLPVLDLKTLLNLDVNYGNLAGTAVDPSDQIVEYANLEVTQWKSNQWFPGQYNWNWLESGWVNANEKGEFALDLSGPAFYQIKVKQGWGDTKPFADASYIVEVDESKNWCVHSLIDAPQSGSVSSPVPSCNSFTNDNVIDDGRKGLTLSLKSPTVSGIVSLPSGKVASNSMVTLAKKNATGYYEYVSSSITNWNGKFYFNPSGDGEYKIIVHPSWALGKEVIEFDTTFCLGLTDSCQPKHDLVLTFPEPNVKGILKCAESLVQNCIEAAASYSSISIEKYVGTSWIWQDKYSFTDRSGNFSFLLDKNNKYRMRFWPNDPSRQGSSLTQEITVSADGLTCNVSELNSTSPCLGLSLSLLDPNLMGQITFGKTASETELNRKVVPYSWINIFDSTSGAYVASAPTNKQGKFAISLPVGEYSVTAYGNSSYTTKSYLTFYVKIATGNLTTWGYASNSMNSTALVADFDQLNPNVSIKLPSSISTNRTIEILDTATASPEPRRLVVVKANSLGEVTLTKDKTYSFKLIVEPGETMTNCSANLNVTKSESEVNSPSFSGAIDQVDLSSCVISRS